MANLDKKALYRLTYRVDGKVCFAEMLAKGERLRNLFTPFKEAHVFEGWENLPERMPAEDLVIDGKLRPMSFKLTFLLDGEVLQERTLPFGAKIEDAPVLAERDGYAFSGWIDLPETMPAEDLTLTGRYLRDSYRLTYVVGGKHRFTVHLPFGAKIEPLDLPIKDEHVFSGWENLPETMPADDIVVGGTFELKSFRLTRIVDGEVFMAEDLPIGAKIDKKVKPVKPGYYFSGWRKLPDTMPDHDITAITSMYPVRYRVDYEIDGEPWRTTYVPYTSAFVPEMPEERQGYAFAWSDAPAVMPMQDIVVHGSYTETEAAPVEAPAPSYTARFLLDGELLLEMALCEGDALTAPDAPERSGYTFVGFGDVPAAMPAGDLSFEGRYAPCEYRLSFFADGELISSESVPFGAPITLPEAPQREGFAFTGWAGVPVVMPAEDLSFEGSYRQRLYEIVFAADGEVLSRELLPVGAEITVPPAPCRIGYTFAGFGDVPAAMPARDLCFEGSYTQNEYCLSFIADGELMLTESLPFGAAVAAPDAPERDGFRFLGWENLPASMPAEDLTVKGSYGRLTYTLCAAVDGETVYSAALCEGQTYVLPEMPVRRGFVFAWDCKAGKMPAGDLTVAGGYRALSYTLTFAIDGETAAELDLPYGAPITAPDAPVREGFAFAGWENLPETMPDGDLTVSGAYLPKLYRMTFVVDGETVAECELPKGVAPIVPEMPLREGFSFAWTDAPAVMPAEDLTVEGFYTADLYRLVFTADGEVLSESELTFGSEIVPPAVAHRLGFTFSGFGELPETMPASDLICSATFSRNSYRLTAVAGTETLLNTVLAYGAPIALPDAPDRHGCTFDGWGEVPDAMPAHDLTVVSGYTPQAYRLSFVLDDVVLSDTELSYGSPVLAPLAEIGEGRIFDGWGELPRTMPAEDLTVRASTRAALYHLTYLLNGEPVLERDVAFGEPLPTPEIRQEQGYTFTGYDVPQTMPARDLVLEAEKMANLYRLTVMLDGEILSEDSLAYGSEIAAPAIPVRDGYSFSGWGDVPPTMPAEDLTLCGSFMCDLYRIRFVVDGAAYAELWLAPGEPITVPEAPARAGCSFSGWDNVPACMPEGELTVFASFTPDRIPAELVEEAAEEVIEEVIEEAAEEIAEESETEFTVRFYVDSVLYAETSAPAGCPIALPDLPCRQGYTFSGWSNFSEIMPCYDYSALGSFEANRHTVTYIVMGEELSVRTVAYGSVLEPPAAPERFDGEFIEWIDLPETMPDRDLVIEASYSTPLYRVTYRIDGEIFYEADVAVGRLLPKLNPPRRSGLTFEGWHNLSKTMPAYPITVTGRYVPTVRTLTYLAGDRVLETRQYRVGEPVVSIDGRNPLLGEFEGWFGLPHVMPDSDVTAVARYKPKTYTVTYLLDGKPVTTQVLEQGAPIAPPAAPARENAVFREWQSLPETMPAQDLIVCGVYEPTAFTLTYRVGGETVCTQTYPVGARVRPAEAPMRRGERFLMWRNFTDRMPAYDFTADAVYAPNVCRYSFVVDGEILLEGTACAGEPILSPVPRERDGLDFAGFEGYDGIMPSEDTVFVGKYVPKTYYLYYIFDGAVVREAGYREGETVGDAPTADELPIKAGYEFLGWSEIPKTMPNHNVDVIGGSAAKSFRLTVVADGRTVSEQSIPTDAPIAHCTAPRRHGYTFRGWQGLPDFMPPHDITVNGSYEKSEPEYRFYALPGASVMSDGCVAEYTPERKIPRRKRRKFGSYSNVIYVRRDRIEMVSGGRCYTLDVSQYLGDGTLTDRKGLKNALLPMAAAASARVTHYHLVIDSETSLDGIYEFATSNREEIEGILRDRMLDEMPGSVSSPEFVCNYLSADVELGTVQLAASVVDGDFFSAIHEVLRECGLPVGKPVTPQMSMLCFMQKQKFHARRGSLIEILTGGYVMLGLYVNRKIVCTFKNAVPFDVGYDELEAELKTGLDRIFDYIEEEDIPVKISQIYYGGFCVSRLRELIRMTRKLTRTSNRSGRRGIAAYFTVRRPSDLEVSYPFVKRKKKVVEFSDRTPRA